jgi:hypothetical protein
VGGDIRDNQRQATSAENVPSDDSVWRTAAKGMALEHAPELRDLTLRLYEALSIGDVAYLEQRISREPGVLGIGTDPQEWWPDHTSLVGAFRTQIQEVGGGFPVTAGDPQAYREGPVGWVADRATFNLPDLPPIPFRLTMVLHQETGTWKLIQWHISLGVANEEVVGHELTIEAPDRTNMGRAGA